MTTTYQEQQKSKIDCLNSMLDNIVEFGRPRQLTRDEITEAYTECLDRLANHYTNLSEALSELYVAVNGAFFHAEEIRNTVFLSNMCFSSGPDDVYRRKMVNRTVKVQWKQAKPDCSPEKAKALLGGKTHNYAYFRQYLAKFFPRIPSLNKVMHEFFNIRRQPVEFF